MQASMGHNTVPHLSRVQCGDSFLPVGGVRVGLLPCVLGWGVVLGEGVAAASLTVVQEAVQQGASVHHVSVWQGGTGSYESHRPLILLHDLVTPFACILTLALHCIARSCPCQWIASLTCAADNGWQPCACTARLGAFMGQCARYQEG